MAIVFAAGILQPSTSLADNVSSASDTSIYQTYINDSSGRKNYVITKLNELESIINNSQSDIVSESKQAAALIEYCTWVISMEGDNIFSGIKTYYGGTNYQKLAKKFNDRYAENTDLPMIVWASKPNEEFNTNTLKPEDWNSVKELKEIETDDITELMKAVVGIWGPYYFDTLATQLNFSDTDNLSDSSKKAGAYLYKVYRNMPLIVKNMSSNPEHLSGGADVVMHDTFIYSSIGSSEQTTMHIYSSDMNNNYSFLSQALSDLMNNTTIGGLATDTTKKPMENLANVTYNADSDTYTVPKDVELSASFEAFFAASAAYVPFVSYSGSQEFQSIVTSLCSDATTAADLLTLYNDNKNIRKPLYKRELDANGDPTGVATLVTVDDFINIIQEGQSYAFCTIKGELVKDKDTGAWVYRTKKNSAEYQKLEDLNLDLSYNDLGNTDGVWFEKLADSFKPLVVQAAQFEEQPDLEEVPSGGSTLLENAQATVSAKQTATPTPESSKTDGTATPTPESSQTDETTGSSATPTPAEEGTQDNSNTTVNSEVSSATSTATASGTATTSDDGVKISVDAYNKLPAYQEITDESAMTDPVLMTSSTIYRAVDNMTYMLLYNVLKSTVTTDLIIHSSTRYLYLNAFGDIVMDDNLVIVPAAANPLYYKADSEYPLATAAFQNSYPALNVGISFKAGSEHDIDKYVLMENDEGDEAAPYVIAKIVSSTKVEKTKLRCRDLTAYMTTEFSARSEKIAVMKKQFYFSMGMTVIPCPNISINKTKVFPYYPITDVSKSAAKAIARSMFINLALDQDTNETKNNKTLNDNYILNYVIKSALDGTEMVDSYTSDIMMQYDEYEENSFERFSNSIVDLTETVENSMSYERGVLSLQNPYTVKYVGFIYNWVRDNIFYVIVLIVVFIVLCYVRNSVDLLKLGVLVAFNVGLTAAFIYYLPNLTTYAFNFLTNNISQNMAYEILAIKSELLSNEGNSTSYVYPDGRSEKSTTSITLHKYTRSELQEFLNGYSTDSDTLTGGKLYVIDSETGLYIENDCLKMNVDKIFANLKIKGGYGIKSLSSTANEAASAVGTSTTDGASYTIAAYKTVSDNLDYYTPFYEFVDGFILKLNKMCSVCSTVPSQIVYSDGTVKDSFAVYSYLNSPMFVTPGQYTNDLDKLDMESVQLSLDDVTTESADENDFSLDSSSVSAEAYYKSFSEYAEALKLAFGSSKDWLGISPILLEVADTSETANKLRSTVWAQTMRENGYYYEDWTCNQYKIAELVAYVNKETKKFAIEIDPLLKSVSDDVLIKLICLRALTAFNQEIMTKDAIAYPLFVNYDEITIHDVLTALIVTDIPTFSAVNQSLADYVKNDSGWFMVVVLALTILLMFSFVLLINVTIPLLCMVFTLMLIFKLSNYLDSRSLIHGFCKVIGLLAVDFTLFSTGISLVSSFEGGVITLVSLISLVSVCTLLYKFVLSAVFSNFSDLGNIAVTAKLKDFAGKLGGFKPLKNLSAQNLITGENREDSSDFADDFSTYLDGADIDQMYLGNDYVNYWEDDR